MEPLGSGDLRIWMTDTELSRWGLSLDDMRQGTPTAESAMRRLLGVARQRLVFPTDGQVLVEALPLDDGCVLVFSTGRHRAPPVAALPQVYRLPSAEALLQFAEVLAGGEHPSLPASSLYRRDDVYYLILYTGLGPVTDCRRLLQEFAERVGEGQAAASFITEHTVPVAVGDALHQLLTVYESRRPTPPHPAR